MATSNYTPQTWATAVLDRLGYQPTRGSVQALVGWAKAEGGHWNNDARFNPLNTTQSEPGAGNTGSQGNIKAYRSWDQGIDATVKTLRNGRYGGILSGLEHGDPRKVASAIGQSPWGTAGGLVQQTILGTKVASVPSSPSPAGGTGASGGTQTTTTTTPGVDNSGLRRQLVADFLSQGGVKSAQASAAFATGIHGAQDTPGSTSTSTRSVKLDPATATVSGHGVQVITDRAERLSKDRRPYVWGGGHGGDSWGLDCSGAVSQALGVDVRVASEFEKFGKPGKGKDVTIYANDGHVLMEINGHFWGTSRTNPEGGPGWIPRSAIPASYLKNFTARHPNGM